MKTLNPWLRTLAVCGTVALIVASLYWASPILIPFVLSVLIAFILTPLVVRLQRAGLGRVPAALSAVAVACAVVAALGLIVFYQVRSLGPEVAKHKEVIIEKFESVAEFHKGSWLETLWDSLAEIAERISGPAPEGQAIPVQLVTNEYWSRLGATVGPTLDFLVNVGLVIILVTFMLIGREDLRNRLIRLSGTKRLTAMTRALDDASERISRFLLMQLIINGTYGMAAGVGLFLIGVPYAFLWGFLAAALRYIPYLGPVLGALLPLALTLAVSGWLELVLVGLLFVALELVSNNWMEPWLYGRTVGVSEIAVIVGAAFWGWLWGPIGLVLSTPMTAVLATLGRYLPGLEFLHVMFGDKPVLEPHVAYFQRLLAKDEDEAAELIEEYAKEHPRAAIYENVLLPALHLARVNQDREELSDEDVRRLYEAAEQTLDEASAPLRPAGQVMGRKPGRGDDGDELPLVLGVPARDAADEMALRMFGHTLELRKLRYEVISQETLTGELLARVREERPEAVCVFAMPPGGLTPARTLCKRLRAEFSELKILVCCWKRDDDPGRLRELLTGAGADALATGLVELREALSAQLPVLAEQAQKREPVAAR